MAMLSPRVALGSHAMGLLRCLRVPALGAAQRQQVRRQSRAGAVRAVWKQEVLWAEAPVADVGLECEEHYHFVLDISGNRELMEGHTKAGQFVQVPCPGYAGPPDITKLLLLFGDFGPLKFGLRI
jgi:hypothetical protein